MKRHSFTYWALTTLGGAFAIFLIVFAIFPQTAQTPRPLAPTVTLPTTTLPATCVVPLGQGNAGICTPKALVPPTGFRSLTPSGIQILDVRSEEHTSEL